MSQSPLGKLILLRHGESQWNLENRFTGWVDVDLTPKGIQEAVRAGELLTASKLFPAAVHTSLLKRAIETAHLALRSMEMSWLPVHRSFRLNERHYGALQGKNKKETLAAYGEAQFQAWRRSYDVPPPPLSLDDPGHARHDLRYRDLPPTSVPSTECLKDVLVRLLPYWEDKLVPELRTGKNLLVVAHGNSLRALVKHLDQLSEEDVVALNIPTGIPLVYSFTPEWNPEKKGGTYLDEAAAKIAMVTIQNQGRDKN